MRLIAWAAMMWLIGLAAPVQAQAPGRTGVVTHEIESVRIAIDVGAGRSWIDVEILFPIDDPEAMRRLAKGEIGDLACTRLRRLRVQSASLCDLMGLDAEGAPREQRVSLGEDGPRVRLIFAVDTESFLMRADEVTAQIIGPPLDVRLAARFRGPYSVTGADPVPDSLAGGRMTFRLFEERDQPVRIHVVRGFQQPRSRERSARLLGSPSSVDGERRRALAGPALNAVAGTVGLLVPPLAAIGLLRRLSRRERTQKPARRATALSRMLALLVALPVAYYGLSYLLPGGPELLSKLVKPLRDPLGDMALPVGLWLLRCFDVILAAILVAAAFAAFTRLGRRLGTPIRFPSLGFALTLLAFAATIQTMPIAIGLIVGPQSETTPLEIYAGAALLIWAAMLIWVAASAARLFDLSAGSRLVLYAVLVVSMLPWRGWPDFMPGGTDAAQMVVAFQVSHLRSIAHAATFLPLLWLLRRLGSRRILTERLHLAHLAGGAMFAAALMPLAYGWSMLVAALAALTIVWPRLALSDPATARAKGELAGLVLSDLAGWVERLERAAALIGAARRTKLDAKLSEGEVTPAEWGRRRQALESARDKAVAEVFLPGGLNARDLVLGLSVEQTPWRSGLRAAAYGAPIVAILTLLRIAQGEAATSTPGPDPVLDWLSTVLPPAAKMAASTFLLGYFFDRLRGGTGLNKALWLGTAFCAAESLIWLPQLADANVAAGILWTFSQHFLLLIPVGVLAFDYSRMRQVEGHGFDWRRFSWFGDPRLLSTGVAASLAALGPTVATLFSGSFSSAVKDVVTAVAPTLIGN